MLSERMMKIKKVSARGLVKLFRMAGHPLSYMAIKGLLMDQNWSYIHGLILYKAGMWQDPDVIVTEEMVLAAINKPRKKPDDKTKYKPRKKRETVYDKEDLECIDDYERSKIIVRHM